MARATAPFSAVSRSSSPPGVGQLVDQAAGLQQPVDGAVRRQRPAERCVVVHQPGQPVRPLDRVVDAEHRRADRCRDLARDVTRWTT